MSKKMKQAQLALTVFGLFVVAYNIFELITNKYSTSQGIIFVIESLAGIVLIYLPNIARKLLKIEIPAAIVLFYWFFLTISVFIGTGLHVISLIFFWDKVLHAVSPMLLTVLGYGLIATFLKDADISKTSPWLFIIMGFAFAGLCGVFWEFWEFLCDQFFNMNLQRYNASSGTPFIGREALMDTMGDLFTNTLGALALTIFAGVKSHNHPEYFEQFKIKKLP
ncbi:hypothetical protein ACYSNU_12960 [Enterococcus sp. LJL120]|uniref:hypothetical protein n=1 Tax=Enterococcus sp. HY326 TaxID=2971265 RepID=UPI00223E9B7C|nr:hypothetical protein [Enterococcus sp. HY326]